MSKPLDYFKYKNGELHCEEVPISEIIKETGTPVYIYSSQAFLSPLHHLQEGLKELDPLICFAVKSNSNLSILRMLLEKGAGLDLVSGGELFRAAQVAAQADRIVFSGVGKTRTEMMDALRYQNHGIYSFHVESVPELVQLNEVAEKLGKKAGVALRFNPDVDPKTHPYISTGLKKNKFGLNRAEVLQVINDLGQLPGIQLKGISIHIGSQLLSLAPLADAFKKLRGLVEEIHPRLKAPLEFLDLGGGVGITYKNEKAPSLNQYCTLVRKHFGGKWRSRIPIRILIEPGRSISGNAGILATEVLYRKSRKQKDFLIVDAGMNDLMRPALYQSYHEIVPIDASLKGNLKKTDLVGPVCESADCFGGDRLLSSRIDSGHHLAILSAGAYGFSMANNYNSRQRPVEVLVQGREYQVIRSRETFEDLIRGEQLGQSSSKLEGKSKSHIIPAEV